jgi:hypothetical protein
MAPVPITLESISVASAALYNIAKRSESILERNLSPIPRPTPTVPSLWTRITHLRQTTGSIIPASYGSINSGPDPGTVVGIVLGSIGGLLLLLWLFYTCINFGTFGGAAYREETVRSRSSRRKSHHSSSHRSRRVSEVRQTPLFSTRSILVSSVRTQKELC